MTPEQDNLIIEMLSGIYIQQMRLYDVMCVIGDKLGADVIGLKNLHEQGYILAPDPALRLDDTDENVDPSGEAAKSQKPSDN